MTRPIIAFAYRFGLFGGVCAQLLNRLPAFSTRYDLRFLFEEDHGVSHHFPADSVSVTPTVEEQREAIDSLQPDVLVVIDSPRFLEAWRRSRSRPPMVLEVHTTTSNIRYLDEIHPDVDLATVITVSEYMRERLEASPIRERCEISVVPNCLHAGWFEEHPPVGLEGTPLVWVGKLDGHKRFRTALDLMDRVIETAPDLDIRPLVVGGYTARAERIESLLGSFASRSTLRRGHWVPFVEYERMPLLLGSVAASGGGSVATTKNESFGMAVAESIVVGCPVVAPAVGGLPELLPAAALFEEGDWASARSLTIRMLRDADFRAELLSTRERVTELVRPVTTLQQFEQALGSLLASPSGAAG